MGHEPLDRRDIDDTAVSPLDHRRSDVSDQLVHRLQIYGVRLAPGIEGCVFNALMDLDPRVIDDDVDAIPPGNCFVDRGFQGGVVRHIQWRRGKILHFLFRFRQQTGLEVDPCDVRALTAKQIRCCAPDSGRCARNNRNASGELSL